MRTFMAAVSLLCFSGAAALPARADDGYGRQATGASMGVYFHIPLGGTPKARKKHPFDYGIALRFNRSYYTASNSFVRSRSLEADVVKLHFGADGFQKLSLTGRNILMSDSYRRAAAGDKQPEDTPADTTSSGGSKVGSFVLGAVGTVGALFLLAEATKKSDNSSDTAQ